MAKHTHVEYRCSYCGENSKIRSINDGRPMPGFCPRKARSRDGRMKPHSWVINRKLIAVDGFWQAV